jgi:hypothetical protein
MSTEENKAVSHSFCEALGNADLDTTMESLASDVVVHGLPGLPPGREAGPGFDPASSFRKHERHKSWRHVLIFVMPPFLKTCEGKPAVCCGIEELGDMMHKGWNFDSCLIALKHGSCAQVLFERVQFAHEQASRRNQTAKRFREDEGQIGDVLKHQVAHDQVNRLIGTWPWVREIRDSEGNMVERQFRLCPRDHTFRKIDCVHVLANLGEEGRILPGTAAKLKDGSAMQAGQCVPRDYLIEITRQVPI